MSLLEKLVSRHMCRSSHDLIVIHALGLIDADWRAVFLVNHRDLLQGANAPLVRFKDYENHVLHVADGEWGGARGAAMKWYADAVHQIRARKWHRASFALGALGYYYSRACQPLSTDQTEEKSAVQAAFERSLTQSWDSISARIETGDYPDVSIPDERGFVSTMTAEAASRASADFQAVIDHFDFRTSVETPAEAMDEKLLEICADHIGHAIAGFAALVRCAIAEADTKAPKVPLRLLGYLAAPSIQARRLSKARHQAKAGRQVQKMYSEYERSGKCLKTLPPIERALRSQYANEVLRLPLKALDAEAPGPIGRLNQQAVQPQIDETTETAIPEPDVAVEAQKPAWRRRKPTPQDDEIIDVEFDTETQEKLDEAYYTKLDAEIEAELSEELEAEIAEKIAEEIALEQNALVAVDEDDEFALDDETEWSPGKLSTDAMVADALLLDEATDNLLHAAGVMTVEDLLCVDVSDLVEFLDSGDITAAIIKDWQDQAMLMMRVGGLRAFDAQVLIASGIKTADELAAASAQDVLRAAQGFLSTPTGSRAAEQEDAELDEADAQAWIDLARG